MRKEKKKEQKKEEGRRKATTYFKTVSSVLTLTLIVENECQQAY